VAFTAQNKANFCAIFNSWRHIKTTAFKTQFCNVMFLCLNRQLPNLSTSLLFFGLSSLTAKAAQKLRSALTKTLAQPKLCSKTKGLADSPREKEKGLREIPATP
jgi:hypothetical protein